MKLPRSGIGLFAFLLFAAWLAAAADATAATDLDTRPGVGGEPTEVTVLLGVLDIVTIENRAQLFCADIYVEVMWQDARLADAGAAEFRTLPVDEIWSPRLTVLNDRGPDLLLPLVATVDRDGNVTLRQRLAGPLAVNLDLRRFPFDVQRLPIEIVSYRYAPDELVFSPRSELVGQTGELSGDDWHFRAGETERTFFRFDDRGAGRSLLTFTVVAERQAGYYVLTLVLPMTLIMFLAWMVHWLPPDMVPARMGMASATVFSLIAFGVSFRLTLPEIGYLTAADRFVMYSILLVLVSLALTVATVRRVSAEQHDAAVRLTQRARIAFPFLYALAVVLLLS